MTVTYWSGLCFRYRTKQIAKRMSTYAQFILFVLIVQDHIQGQLTIFACYVENPIKKCQASFCTRTQNPAKKVH